MDPKASWSLAALSALILVIVHEGTLLRATESFSQDAKDLAAVSEIRNVIDSRWVESPKEGQLLDGALKGMVGTLDRFSDFISATELEDFEEATTGKFGGLGIYIGIEEGLILVIAPIEDTPAWKAGMLPGDLVYTVDGKPCEFANASAAVRALKGEVGTSVTLEVLHEGAKRLETIEIERAIIQIRSVKGTRLLDPVSKIGYMRITTFNSGTVKEFEEEVQGLVRLGMRGLILDLRGNPGGFLSASVQVADAFLDKGQVIVKTRGRDTDYKETEATSTKLVDVPTALLINRGSASASEILGGALSDHGKAFMVGARSFGKGSVQSIIPVLAGEAELKLTTQYYFTPKGRRIHRGDKPKEDKSWGLLPDLEVAITRAERAKVINREGDVEMERLKAQSSGKPLELEERLHKDDPQVRAAYSHVLESLGDPVPSDVKDAAGSEVAAVDSADPTAANAPSGEPPKK